jgi:thioredoxin-like negative regulator of GroEL
MDRVYLMGGTLALAGGLLLARGIRILWKGEASLADALPVFGLLGKLFLSGFQLKGGWARVASIPIFLLSLTALAGGGSLIALKYFRPQELEGVMLSAAAKLAKDNPSDGDKKAVAGETVGQMKDLLAGLKNSSQARADAAVSVPEADLGPIPVSHPMGNDFRKFVETPGKLSVVILEVPQDEAAVKLREMIERVGRRFSNVAQVAYFDLDTWPELGEDQGVTQVPDVRFFRDGKKVDGFVGVPVKDVVLLEKFVRHSQGLTPSGPMPTVSEEPASSSASTFQPRDLTERELDSFVQQPDRLVAIAYCADWCRYSRQLDTFLQILGPEFAEVAAIGRIDVERVSQEFARKQNLDGVPKMALYRDGKVVKRNDGLLPIQELRKQFTEHTADLRAQREAAAKTQPATPARTSNEPAVQPMKKGWLPAGMEKR